MRTNLLFISLACTSSLLAAGCDDGDEATPKTQQEYDDVARSVGSSIAAGGGGEATAVADLTSIALGVMPVGFGLGAEGHIGGSRFGLSYEYGLQCQDAAGNPLDTCDATTDRAEVEVAWAGQLVLLHFAAGVERTGHWTFTGLQSAIATLDGDSALALDSTISPPDRPVRTYDFAYAAEFDGVLVDVADRALVGGTIRYGIDAERTVGGEVTAWFTMDGTLVFGPDRSATLTLDGEHRYAVDIGTGVTHRL